MATRFTKYVGTAVAACLGLALAAGGGGCYSGPTPHTAAAQRDAAARPQADARAQSEDGFDRGPVGDVRAETHFAAGQLAEAQDALPRAVEQYRKALERDPKHLESLFRLGVVFAKLKQFPDAIATWTRYIAATGGDATAYGNLGFCYELAGRNSDAENAYLKGIRKDPTNGPCRVNYGLMLARHGRLNEATLQLQTVLPEPQVRYNLASVYEWMGRREQARLEYKRALELDPGMKEAQARLDAIQ